MTGLLRELVTAHKLARSADLADALTACGLPTDGPLLWGVSFVGIDAHHYCPTEGGKPAIIVPVYDEGGALLDLVATGIETRATRTRAGIATVLGRAWIERARETETAARLFSDPLEWLRNGGRGACIVDWRAARYELADLPGIACYSELLAKRVARALKQPVHIPQLFVRETFHAAA
jgi:hypothetical protein